MTQIATTPLFTYPPEDYGRDLDFIGNYKKDAATYLASVEKCSFEEALAFVEKETGVGGKFQLKDPVFQCLVRGSNGDREKKNVPFERYTKFVVDNGHITSPTFAVYTNPKKEVSLWARYIELQTQKRDKAKAEQHAAKRAGNLELEKQKKIEQVNAKVKNNSMSGAQASSSTPLYNKSAHSSLTSTCRSAATTANALNERFFMGNRHYHNPEIVLANIISIINHSDYESIERCMVDFNIRAPTCDEVCDAIKFSTNLYWKSTIGDEHIRELVESLTDIQRAAYLYTGDFYHLTKINPEFTKRMLDRLISRPPTITEDPYQYIHALDADLVAYIGILCSEELSQPEKDNYAIHEIETKKPEVAAVVGTVAKNIKEVLEDYRCFFKAFWVTPNLPASMAVFPTSIRAAAIVSDTDSTIFSVSEWADWYCGRNDFTQESTFCVATMIYLGSQVLSHCLALISGNMGVETKRIHQLTMKNEFMFPVFVPTGLAKHYYAYMSACEGNVYKTFKKEIKGVHLKSSKVPREIIEGSNDLLTRVMDAALKGKQLRAFDILKEVADVERNIISSLKAGDLCYLTSAQQKPQEAYKEVPGPYFNYLLWEEVFAPRYGHAPQPPYAAVRVSIECPNPTAHRDWLDGFEDQDMANRLQACMDKYGKKTITSMIIPLEVVINQGVPQELLQGMNVRSIISNTMKSYYIILESLNLFFTNKHLTKLVSDFY